MNNAYYFAANPDVAATGIDPMLHYEASGWREGRDPGALFSRHKYLAAYTDVANTGVDPLAHYPRQRRRRGTPGVRGVTGPAGKPPDGLSCRNGSGPDRVRAR